MQDKIGGISFHMTRIKWLGVQIRSNCIAEFLRNSFNFSKKILLLAGFEQK